MGEKDLNILVKNMSPHLNEGTFVFVSLKNIDHISRKDTICEFKEKEGVTLVLKKSKADAMQLNYSFIASWISLNIHSSLDAVGLTAVVSSELTKHQISCNIIAGFHHDHLFVNTTDTTKALSVLKSTIHKFLVILQAIK